MIRNCCKYILPLALLLCFGTLKAQMFIPKFEPPQRLSTINDSTAEQSLPFPFNNGENLYFVRTHVSGSLKDKSKGQDIYSAERVNGQWQMIEDAFKQFNDKGNNAVVGTSADGNTLYLFNSIHSHKKLVKGISYTSKDSTGEWGKLTQLVIPEFELGLGNYSFYMNPEENILLASMSPNDTTFEEDLFVSLKNDSGQWQPFINLGDKINTSGFEVAPYIAKDQKTLYFSSDGHPGLGNADVFVAYRLSDSWTEWTKPLNMGAPVNSDAFDAYYVMGNNREVFFTSNRGSELSDIFYTKSTGDVGIGVKVLAQFKYNGLAAENTKLLVYDNEGNLIEELVTDEYGNFSFFKLKPDANYVVKLAAEDPVNYPGGVVYVVDEKGRKLKRLLIDDNGQFVEDPTMDDEQLISGIFNYNSLPVANTRLIIYDENGFPVDTILTDEYGRFSYEKIQRDENISIRPMDGEDVAGIVYFLDEDDKRINRFVVSSIENSYIEESLAGNFRYNQLIMANTQLVIFDENGFPIDTVITDAYGNFKYDRLKYDQKIQIKPLGGEDVSGLVYFTDENGNKVARYVVSGDDAELEAQLLAGVFKYNQLPVANSTLIIYDKDGYPIDTVITDEYGRFNYEKMGFDDEISIQLLKDSDSGGLVYFTDENGNKVARYVVSGDEAMLEDELMKGIFEYNSLPLANTSLVVYDENGFPIDTIVTDSYGRFQYNKMGMDNEFILKPIDANDIDGLVYVKDENGNRVGRYVVTKDGRYISDGALLERELIEGQFQYNQLPMKNTALVLLDENGYPVDTFYTDASGNFSYNKMKIDENFSIKPLSLEDDMSLEGASMFLKTEKLARKEPNSKDMQSGFGFNSKAKFSEPKMIPPPVIASTPKKGTSIYSYDDDPNYQPQANDDYIIYFFYNDWKVKANDAEKIDHIADAIKSGQKVKLVGHADNIGSAENNLKVAKMRAEAVRDYLVQNGISVEEKILIIAHGERYPVGDNETSEGRGKNRRVEIFVRK